jgi:hypothetical protein
MSMRSLVAEVPFDAILMGEVQQRRTRWGVYVYGPKVPGGIARVLQWPGPWTCATVCPCCWGWLLAPWWRLRCWWLFAALCRRYFAEALRQAWQQTRPTSL